MTVEILNYVGAETNDGIQVNRNLPYEPARFPFRPGYRFAVTVDTQNIFDILIDPATMVGADGYVQLMGGTLWVPDDAHEDDYIEAVVVDKDGVIPDTVDGTHDNLMDHYGLPYDGTAALEVSDKFLEKANVPVGNPKGRNFNPGGNEMILGGLYLRIILDSSQTSGWSKPLRLDINFAK